VFDRLLDDGRQVQRLDVATVREGEARLHLRILFRDRLQHAIGNRALEGRLKPARIVDLDVARAIAIDGITDASNAWIERGRSPLHLEGEIDLPLRLDARK